MKIYNVSEESIEHYFRELAERSPIDILLYNIRSKLACLLGDCGFDEAAAHCQRTDHDTPPSLNERIDVETIVREVVRKLHPGQ